MTNRAEITHKEVRYTVDDTAWGVCTVRVAVMCVCQLHVYCARAQPDTRNQHAPLQLLIDHDM